MQEQEKQQRPQYFILVTSATDDDAYDLPYIAKTMREANTHMNDRNLYPDPSAWRFRVIRGRELPTNLKTTVGIEK